MSFYRWTSILFLLAAISVSSKSHKIFASALPPNVHASSSVNGRFLVVAEWEYENPNDKLRRIRRTTYKIMETESFINSKDRLTSPVKFWSDSAWSWEVTLEGLEGKRIFWPMISDDGKSLILIAVTAPIPGQPVLEIYQRNDHKGQLIRSYQITDLWTPKQVDPDGRGLFIFTDATPEWFAGAILSFSSDGQQLIYRNQWNEVLRIRVDDGVISRSNR
ncbi:hypothetical protein [Tunturibacter empetritectus]|uniref:S9 family peptidase n=1 Tax=Tunturiibacter empetritectus TaxID=3069691 RepID=A0A7W8IIM8_9BACT|nr:hypothetical protein [Edaphobacter lichenicola]MBB5317851.1 hypothetical protein [Edaphobacter lichenicola]